MSSTVPSPAIDYLKKAEEIVGNIEKVIFGKRRAVELAVVGLLAEGHVLLEDVPGTGKTTLARALARSVGGEFCRIQFTSDLLPSDVIGVNIYHQQSGRFQFTPGPIFGNIILADELNRTSPRTQSALLECMNERRVSLDGETHQLPSPFFVIATQNPLEFEGTYPLPESQLDRFMLRVRVGYPNRDTERAILQSRKEVDPLDSLEPVLNESELHQLTTLTRKVRVEESLVEYLLDLIEATRNPKHKLLLGASPRAATGLYRATQAMALVHGRNFAIPDDIKALFIPALAHRVICRPEHEDSTEAVEDLLSGILETSRVPQ